MGRQDHASARSAFSGFCFYCIWNQPSYIRCHTDDWIQSDILTGASGSSMDLTGGPSGIQGPDRCHCAPARVETFRIYTAGRVFTACRAALFYLCQPGWDPKPANPGIMEGQEVIVQQTAWQRFRKAALAFVVLALVLSLCGWWLREHFASTGELAALVLGFSACATLGMPFTATLAEKLCAAHKPLGLFAPAIISGVIGAGLGMILFMAGMFLVIYHTNSQYLNFLGI